MRARVIPEVEDIVAACVDRLERGQATVEECLAAYPPEVTARLEPMLHAAEWLTQLDIPAMDADALLRVEARLLAHAEALPAETRLARGRSWAGLFARLAAVAMIITLVVALGGGGFLAVSANSLPGSPLYPVKRASETIQLGLTRDPDRQATLHTTFGLRRLQEAVQLNKQLKRWDPSTLKDMEQEFAQATGPANAKVVWEHIAAAAASGEKELAEHDGEDDLARTAADALRRLHTRAERELGRDSELDSQEPTSTSTSLQSSAQPLAATATATSGSADTPALAPGRTESDDTGQLEAESRRNSRTLQPRSTTPADAASRMESDRSENDHVMSTAVAPTDGEHTTPASPGDGSEEGSGSSGESKPQPATNGDNNSGDQLKSDDDQQDSGGRDELKPAGGQNDSDDNHGGGTGGSDSGHRSSGHSEGDEFHSGADD